MNTSLTIGMALLCVLAATAVNAELTRQQAMNVCTANGYDLTVGSASWNGKEFVTRHTDGFGIAVQGTQDSVLYETDKRVKAVLTRQGSHTRITEPATTSGTIAAQDGPISDVVFCVIRAQGGVDHRENGGDEPNESGQQERDGSVETDGEQPHEVPEFSTIAGILLAASCLGLIAYRRQ